MSGSDKYLLEMLARPVEVKPQMMNPLLRAMASDGDHIHPRLDPDYPQPVITRPRWSEWQGLENWTPPEAIALSLDFDPVMVKGVAELGLDGIDTLEHPGFDTLREEYEKRLFKLMRSSLVIDGMVGREAVIDWLEEHYYGLPRKLITIGMVNNRIMQIEKRSGSVHRKRVEIANLWLRYTGKFSVDENGDLIIQSTTEEFIEKLVADVQNTLFESVEHLNPDAKKTKLQGYRSTLKHKRKDVKPETFAAWCDEWECNGQSIKPIRFVA